MKQYLIIGNSAAGIAAVEAIRSRDKNSGITVVSDEAYPAYCRCLISYFLSGEVKEKKLVYRPEEFYKENGVELILGKKAARIDPRKSRVVLEDKTQLSFDRLLIATGARPRFPETKGIKKAGVFGFRTLKDAQDIAGLLPVTKDACVLGGGLVGLKAGYALKKRGVHIKIVVKSGHILSQMLDPDGSLLVQKKLEDNGVELLLGEDVSEIIGEGDIRAVKLAGGKVFSCSMVIVGKGVSPNIDLAKESGISCGAGISVNSALETSVPNIFSAGDACESFDVALGKPQVNALWTNAVEQGRIAGANMAGAGQSYAGSLGMNSIEFFGMPIVSIGVHKAEALSGASEESVCDARSGVYKKVVVKDGVLVGAVLVGNIRSSGVYLRLIRERIDVTPFAGRLLEESFGYPDIVDHIQSKENIYV